MAVGFSELSVGSLVIIVLQLQLESTRPLQTKVGVEMARGVGLLEDSGRNGNWVGCASPFLSFAK